MKRQKLIDARLAKGLSPGQLALELCVSYESIHKWESGRATPHPQTRKLIAAYFKMSEQELGLAASHGDTPLVEGSPLEILEHVDSGIAWCHRLINDGARHEIEAATEIAATYLPVLLPMIPTKHGPQASALISKIHHLRRRGSHHYGGSQVALSDTEKAIEYVRLSQDIPTLITMLTHHARAYTWDLPSLCVAQRYKKGATIMEEPIALLEKHRDLCPTQIAAWVHSQHAKFLALTGRRTEARSAIGRAQDCFAKQASSLDSRYFTEIAITGANAIAYMEMGEQHNALKIFLSHLNIETPHVASRVHAPLQVHIATINATITSLLRAPTALKDREMTIRLWEAQYRIARDLESIMYLNESRKQYDIMKCIWPEMER
jgi:transcriptional regulator with XRE-family HTH domain